MASILKDTQPNSAWKRNLQALKNSMQILYLTYKLFDSRPQFLSTTDIVRTKSIQVRQHEGMETGASHPWPIHIWDNFQAAIETFNECNVVRGCHVDTTRADVYWRAHLPIFHFNVFEETWGNRGHKLMLVKCEGYEGVI